MGRLIAVLGYREPQPFVFDLLDFVQMSIRVELLGLPHLSDGRATRALTLNKPTLLLLYLAYRGDWVSRSEAAFLFRPDDEETAALTQLRLLLHRAKPYEWAKTLEATPQQLRFNPSTDVQVFKQAVQGQRWQEAIDLYAAPLLGGYSDPDLPTYSSWLELERASLQNLYESALLSQAQTLEAGGDFASASEVLHKLLGCDPLAETVLQAYLRTTYLAGQREKALKAYDGFQQAVWQEFETEPLPETQTLAQSIRESKPLLAHSPARAVAQPSPLPAQSTRFVGRRQELRELTGQLQQPECRLLTLMGIGGTGKTRLALELAQQVQGSFADGVRFVSLAALDSAEGVVSSLVQSLGLKLAPNRDPKAQLLDYLSNKHLLLVLDNFEQVMAASGLVAEILQRSQNLKLLVTSRESLKLSGEWLFDVQGLSYPGSGSALPPESYDAVQLFVNGVKRVAPQLVLEQSDLDTIAQLCQKLEGHPLAIELASSWARIMPVGRIAQELEQGYDLLQTDLTDLPERQRNLRAILDKTWANLSEKKRQTLARLSVFVGGCTLEAAEQVAGAHYSLLLSLVNESLIRQQPGYRMDLHPLIQQYTAAKLGETADLVPTHQRHAEYFMTQIAQRFADAKHTFLQLYPDTENCRVGWLWLCKQNRLDLLEKALNSIDYLYSMTGRHREGNLVYESTVDILTSAPFSEQRDRLMAGVINGLADRSMVMGHLGQAEQQLGQSLELLTGLEGVEKQLGYVLTSMARLHWQKGEYAQAEQYLYRAAQTVAAIGDMRQETNIQHGLGLILREQGRWAEAQACYSRALELYLGMNELGNAAIALNNIGALNIELGQFQIAQHTFERGLALIKGLQAFRAEAILTSSLAGVFYQQQHYPKALAQYQASLALAEQVQELNIKNEVLRMLGQTLLKLGDPAQALPHLQQSLELSWKAQAWPQLLADLAAFAQYFAKVQQPLRAKQLLAEVVAHPATKSTTRRESQTLLEQLPSTGEPARDPLETLVQQLLA